MTHSHQHGMPCAHEVEAPQTGGVKNLGYHFNRAVPYGAAFDAHGRRAEESQWAGIRIAVQYVSTNTSLTSADETFLRQTLVPAAQSWLQQALAVVPVSGTLLAGRFCGSTWTPSGRWSTSSPPG